MTAVAVIVDSEHDIALVATGDPDGEARRWRMTAKTALGVGLVLWTPGKEAARRVADGARARLVADGFALKGRWLAARLKDAENAIRLEAASVGCRVWTDAERLREACERADYEVRRASR